MKIDLRSDTFTQPTPAMLEAMMRAKVGDDVFGEDPSVNELEAFSAGMFGMEAALFCPSGTMTNQIAINCHTRPGDEVICEKTSHVYQYEGGGIAFNSGCQVKLPEGHRGILEAEQLKDCLNNPEDVHKPLSRLLCLENTSNRGGGSCYTLAEIAKMREFCLSNGLSLHLDGARIWNAMVKNNEDPKEYGRLFDSISVCLSKGLGAPVGSLLLGNKAFIKRARRVRKLLGGGMRQAGFLAAAGLYALQHHIQRLSLDHRNASRIAEALETKAGFRVLPAETNIVIFELPPSLSAGEFVEKMRKKDILCLSISPGQVRMVTHLDISETMTEEVVKTIQGL